VFATVSVVELLAFEAVSVAPLLAFEAVVATSSAGGGGLLPDVVASTSEAVALTVDDTSSAAVSTVPPALAACPATSFSIAKSLNVQPPVSLRIKNVGNLISTYRDTEPGGYCGFSCRVFSLEAWPGRRYPPKGKGIEMYCGKGSVWRSPRTVAWC
jgi:hypothetical protein